MAQFKGEQIHKSRGDITLVALIILLCGLGLCALFSVSYHTSLRIHKNPSYIFNRQIFYCLLFGAWAFFISKLRIEVFRSIIPILSLFTLILLLLPMVPKIGVKLNGASRWINLGPLGTFQPSELAKIISILYLSHKIDHIQTEGKVSTGYYSAILMLFFFVGIIFLQDDISTGAMVFVVGLALLFLGKIPFTHFIGLVAVIAVIVLSVIFSSDYAIERLQAFFHVNADEASNRYQIGRALFAFAQGGALGGGLGLNMNISSGVPEAHCDGILPAIAYEVGFVGLFFICGLVILFGIKGMQIAYRLRENCFNYLLASGITISIVVQFFVNLAIYTELLPTTGLPVPFFSAGGSSLFSCMTMCGILVGLSSTVVEEYA